MFILHLGMLNVEMTAKDIFVCNSSSIALNIPSNSFERKNCMDLECSVYFRQVMKLLTGLMSSNFDWINCRVAVNKLGRMLKRYPSLVKECMPLLTTSLQDVQAKEETALGACNVLKSQPVMRHLRQVGPCFVLSVAML